MKKIILNGEGAVFGRMATRAAKELLKGNSVCVINSEKVILSGKKENIVEKIKKKRRMGSGGSLKGPKYIRQSDRLLKRMIRGMLPWDKPKGREAYKRLKCYIENGDVSETEMKSAINFDHQKPLTYTKINEIASSLK